nr:MAG TPA_asm: hypothetical protein [Bacteriophage sp.]
MLTNAVYSSYFALCCSSCASVLSSLIIFTLHVLRSRNPT